MQSSQPPDFKQLKIPQMRGMHLKDAKRPWRSFSTFFSSPPTAMAPSQLNFLPKKYRICAIESLQFPDYVDPTVILTYTSILRRIQCVNIYHL